MNDSLVQIIDLDQSVKKLIGKLCWKIEWSSITNLSLDFGKPAIRVLREPMNTKSCNKEVRRIASQRLVANFGAWRIWIFHSHWRIVRSGNVLATGSSSYVRKLVAMQQVKGQRIVAITIDTRSGATKFAFDLDTVIETRRLARKSEEDIWTLHGPDKYERSVRGNGSFQSVKLQI